MTVNILHSFGSTCIANCRFVEGELFECLIDCYGVIYL
jgi:hypothetical protein